RQTGSSGRPSISTDSNVRTAPAVVAGVGAAGDARAELENRQASAKTWARVGVRVSGMTVKRLDRSSHGKVGNAPCPGPESGQRAPWAASGKRCSIRLSYGVTGTTLLQSLALRRGGYSAFDTCRKRGNAVDHPPAVCVGVPTASSAYDAA